MNNYHKELVAEIIQKWSLTEIETYIHELEQRRIEMDDWLKHIRTIRRKKVRKPAFETGVRGGM